MNRRSFLSTFGALPFIGVAAKIAAEPSVDKPMGNLVPDGIPPIFLKTPSGDLFSAVVPGKLHNTENVIEKIIFILENYRRSIHDHVDIDCSTLKFTPWEKMSKDKRERMKCFQKDGADGLWTAYGRLIAHQGRPQ